jgi:hypothetical protein
MSTERALSDGASTLAVFSGDARVVNRALQQGGITEAASKKRGRPRVLSEAFRSSAFIAAYYPQIHTERGRQNVKYFYRAVDALKIHPDGPGLAEFGWLIDWESADRYRKGAIKFGILVELGRIACTHGVECAAAAARSLAAENTRTVKQGIAFLRLMRLKATSNRDDFDAWRASVRSDRTLFQRLAVVIDQYVVEHPSARRDEMCSVIDELHRAVWDAGTHEDEDAA